MGGGYSNIPISILVKSIYCPISKHDADLKYTSVQQQAAEQRRSRRQQYYSAVCAPALASRRSIAAALLWRCFGLLCWLRVLLLRP